VLVSRLGRDAVRRHYRRLPSDTNATRQQRCGPRLPVLQPLVTDWLWNICRRQRATWCWSCCRCWLFSSTTATDLRCRLGHIRARRRVSCVGGARSLIPCALHATVALLNDALCSMHDDTVTSVHGAMSALHGAIKAKFHYRDPTGSDRTRADSHGPARTLSETRTEP